MVLFQLTRVGKLGNTDKIVYLRVEGVNNTRHDMKRAFYVLAGLIMVFAVAGCQSREAKANKLIKDYMFKHLHDFKSYEVVETKVDTMYNLPIYDSLCLELARSIKSHLEKVVDYDSDAESDERTMDIWQGGWSTTSHLEYMKAYQSWINNKVHAALERGSYLSDAKRLLLRIEQLDPKEQIGWQAEHTFRSNTLAGNTSLGNYLFLIDKDFKTILAAYEDDDEEMNDAVEAISLVLKNVDSPAQADSLFNGWMELANKYSEMLLNAI